MTTSNLRAIWIVTAPIAAGAGLIAADKGASLLAQVGAFLFVGMSVWWITVIVIVAIAQNGES